MHVRGCAFLRRFRRARNHDLMSRLGIEEPETKAAVQAASADSGEVASRLNEVEGILAKSSLDSYDTDACTSAVLDSFLQSTNDTFTRYIPLIAIRPMST